MTTTNIYTGLQGDKNTSRVLRPPGGGSSNIFGNPEPAAAAPQSKQKPSDSNIFGAPSARATTTPKPQKSAENNIYGASPTKEATPVATKPAVFNPITGEEMRSPEKIGDHASSAKYQPSIGTFNPITGASLEPTKTSVPSTKVRQPPGGASSGLW